MTTSGETPPPAQGRTEGPGIVLVLLAVVALAVNTRTSVASLSPVIQDVQAELGLSSITIGVIGMLPTLCFAAAGLLAPRLARRFALEHVVSATLVVIAIGSVLRGMAPSELVFAIGTGLALLSMGVANVLLPPIVKQYFPTRIGQVTALYGTVVAVSAFVPPLVAVPVAHAFGWRVSLAQWGVFAAVAILPWLFTLRHAHHAAASATAPLHARAFRPWRSKTAWALATLFSVSSLNAYALYAWLPQVLADLKGLDQLTAGAQLSVFAALGVPAALLAPIVATRDTWVRPAALGAAASFIVGFTLLLVLPPAATTLAITVIGFGAFLFPLCLALIGLRSATPAGAAALSGFVQGIGYLVASLGPLALGVFDALTHSWAPAVVFLLVTGVVAIPAAIVAGRPSDYERDERDETTPADRGEAIPD